jgi:predicted nucleic acid-binding protein
MYLLDSNVFIEAKNRYFGFDICPGFWDWLSQRHAAGTVYSVDAVRFELLRGNDQLADWVKALSSTFFLSPEATTAPCLAALSRWANDPAQAFHPNAISVFLSSADYLLTAQARQHGFTVVTQERPDPLARKRIVIPAACHHLGVDFISPFELMRREGLRLVLSRGV